MTTELMLELEKRGCQLLIAFPILGKISKTDYNRFFEKRVI